MLGDRNVGTANALRTLGPLVGGLVFVADVGKGAAAVAIARGLGPGEAGVLLGGVAAVSGNNWPVYLHFHGGRGAATSLGVLSALLPGVLLPLMSFALIPLKITRSSTVALAFVFVPLPLFAWFVGAPGHLLWYSIELPVVVGLSHYLSGHLWPSKAAGLPKEASPRV